MKISLQYIAGFFDGEGSIGVYKTSGKNNWHLRTQLAQNKSNNSTRIMEYLKNRYGGNISIQITLSNKNKYNWQLNSNKCAKFLKDIEPYLVLKKKQAQIAIKWQLSRPSVTRNSKGQIQLSFPEDLKKAKRVSIKLKQLKANP